MPGHVPLITLALLLYTSVVCASALLLASRRGPSGPTPMPDPGPTHKLSDSIAAKKAADSALAAAKTASTAANEMLKADITASGPVFLADAAHPGTFEIWKIDTTSGDPVSFVVSDATQASVPGPPPTPVIPPPTAAELASLAALQAKVEGLDATPEVPLPPAPPLTP